MSNKIITFCCNAPPGLQRVQITNTSQQHNNKQQTFHSYGCLDKYSVYCHAPYCWFMVIFWPDFFLIIASEEKNAVDLHSPFCSHFMNWMVVKQLADNTEYYYTKLIQWLCVICDQTYISVWLNFPFYQLIGVSDNYVVTFLHQYVRWTCENVNNLMFQVVGYTALQKEVELTTSLLTANIPKQ